MSMYMFYISASIMVIVACVEILTNISAHKWFWFVVSLILSIATAQKLQNGQALIGLAIWLIVSIISLVFMYFCGSKNSDDDEDTKDEDEDEDSEEKSDTERSNADNIVRLMKIGQAAGMEKDEAFKWAMEESKKTPKVDANQYFVSGKYRLWGFIPVPWATYFFYTKTNKLVLQIPVLFDMKEEYTEFGNWSDVSFYFGPFAGKVEYKPKVLLPQLPGRKSGDALIAVNIPKRIVKQIKRNWINR